MHQPAPRKTAVRFDQESAYFLNLSGCLIPAFLLPLPDELAVVAVALNHGLEQQRQLDRPNRLGIGELHVLVCSSGQHFKAVFFNHAQQLECHTAWPFLAGFPLLHG